MALKTLKELRDNIASTIRDTQISDLIDSYINLSLQEVLNYYPWTFLRRKTTFTTVASQETYFLDEEIDRIAVLRQTESDVKLTYVPDQLFYKLVPDPSNSTGNPQYYRLWEEVGVFTQLSSNDTVYVKSTSANDGSAFKVVIVGRDTNGLVVSEELTLNGTTAVTSSTTFSYIMQVSKSAKTTGTVTLYQTTGDVVLARIAPEESAPRHKKIGLYPIPSSAITMYVEYFERPRLLVNDADVPQVDHKWNWVIREGALAKAWQYKQNESASALAQRNFENGLRMMRRQDMANPDYIPVLLPHRIRTYSHVRRVSDSVGNEEPVYVIY